MKSAPDRLMLRPPVLAGVLFVTSLLPAAIESASAPSVALDTLVVTTVPDYRPLEPGWQVADVPGFRIFSHGNAAAKSVAEQLQLARAALGLVWNDEALLRRPVTVVVTADEPEFLAWGKVPAAAMDRTVRAIATPSGPVLVVNGGFEAVQRAVGRGYALALLQDTKLPRWLQEGIAQIVNSAEAGGDRLRIGRVQQDPRNHLSLDTLRSLNTQASFSLPRGGSLLDQVGPITNRRGDVMDIRIDGLVPTQFELERYLNDEVERRGDERHVYKPDTDFFNFLSDGVVMSLARVFDPEAPDSVRWRMNAWGFTHYSMFAEKQGRRPAFLKFVQKLEREPGREPVALLQETYGLSQGKIELNLALYALRGNYDIMDYKLAEPFRATAPALEGVAEANILQLRARVLAATDRAGEARQILAHGYANPANRTPAYVNQFIALERIHQPVHAGELLEDAARREQLDNQGRRWLASARLDRLQQAGTKLSLSDVRVVLLPLFVALDQGDQSEELFVLIGRAWAASAVRPEPGHLNALRLGLAYHPRSQRLAELLRELEHS